ncbi:hypothetical protein L8C07_05645 [Paenibacillus sp. CMAA1739]|uniref:hypothetical protein n=1 Tax=Paenibacillus ottowii TaxID=2315729 RepID=UPI002DBE4B15|nr:hypothetical protein [Paenibacillus sp. CMAA1739]MEC4565422.1 hypothetical protein [Paenibacillus sp. CMAA1739]
METIKYIILSMFDGVAIFTFGFGMYQVKLFEYWIQFVVASLCISVATYLYRDYGLPENFAPIVNIGLMIVFLISLFKISLLSSLRISGISFLFSFIAQTIVAVLFMVSTSKSLDSTLFTYGYIVQIAGDSIVIFTSLYLRKKSIWFTTLPYQYSLKFKLNFSNITLFIASILGVTFMSKSIFNNIYISGLFWLAIFVIMIIIEFRKELKDENN